jgi:hypothetical protein
MGWILPDITGTCPSLEWFGNKSVLALMMTSGSQTFRALTHPPFIAAMVVPTGIGASIGGFAGDATPAMNLLASVTDVLITHPNVANAAIFQKLPDNALYVEGYGLDRFMQGLWALRPVRSNTVGVILDAGMSPEMRILHINTINAVKSVYGVDLIGYVHTSAPIDTGLQVMASGCSSGYLRNSEAVLNAARFLQKQGATAIALCTLLPDPDAEDHVMEAQYKEGGGVDPIGGIEAILSHLVVSELEIPCANAPVFSWEKAQPVTDEILDPRTAAEFIAPTFLPCVLTGLSRSPGFIASEQAEAGDITLSQLSALVVPVDALGGIPVLAAMQRGIPIIAVQNNQTVLDMGADMLREAPAKRRNCIRYARTYEEAAGILQAMRLGLRMDQTAAPELSMTEAILFKTILEIGCPAVP